MTGQHFVNFLLYKIAVLVIPSTKTLIYQLLKFEPLNLVNS